MSLVLLEVQAGVGPGLALVIDMYMLSSLEKAVLARAILIMVFMVSPSVV